MAATFDAMETHRGEEDIGGDGMSGNLRGMHRQWFERKPEGMWLRRVAMSLIVLVKLKLLGAHASFACGLLVCHHLCTVRVLVLTSKEEKGRRDQHASHELTSPLASIDLLAIGVERQGRSGSDTSCHHCCRSHRLWRVLTNSLPPRSMVILGMPDGDSELGEDSKEKRRG